MAGSLITAISTNTANHLILDAGLVYLDYGEGTQRLLGATDGGNVFKETQVTRNISLDNKFGDRYKGLVRIVSRDAELTVNLKEMSGITLQHVILGSTVAGTVKAVVPAEYAGIGTTATSGETFTLEHKPIRSSMQFFKDGVRESTWTTAMAVASSTGTSLKIVGENRLTSTQELTVSYDYWSTSTDLDTHLYSKGVIKSTDYETNVTLIAPLSGSTRYVQCYILNALADGVQNLSLTDKNEAVMPITFYAHWTATMAHSDHISGIKYPK